MNFPSIFSPVHLAAFAVALGMFCIGSAMTWTSPVLPKLRDHTDTFFDQPLTSFEGTWISSSLTLGAAVGSFLYGFLATILGRRISWLLLSPAFIVGYSLMYFIDNVEVYYGARSLIGLAVGGGFSLLPLYMGELSSKTERGKILAFSSAAISLGFVYSYSVGPYISLKMFNLSLIIFSSLFAIIFYFFGVETPHFHVLNGNRGSARLVLENTRKRSEDIDTELRDIIKRLDDDSQANMFRSLMSKGALKGFIVSVGLMIFQQMTGIYSFQFYTQEIFAVTGSNISPELSSIIIGSIQTVSAASMAMVIDKLSRKTLLYFSAVGMAICHTAVGVYCVLKSNGLSVESFSIIPLSGLALFIVTFNLGFGTLPSTITGEVFPSKCSNFAISLVVFINWSMTFLAISYTESIVVYFGIGKCFLTLAVCCLLSIFFVKLLVVETKGESLEDIQDRLVEPVSWNYIWMVTQDFKHT